MNSKPGLPISRPISVWNRPLKVSFRDIFKSLTSALVNSALLDWGTARKSAVEAISAIGLEREPGQIAWLLIHRSLIRAMYRLVEQNLSLIKNNPNGLWNLREQPDFSLDDFASLYPKLDFSLEENELIIDDNFFDKPRELPVIRAMIKPFTEWLMGFGLTDITARSITRELPTAFVYALQDEWSLNRQDYECLENWNTPLTKASQREWAWTTYYEWLQKQIEEPMFHEKFSLKDVYIPLRAYYGQKPKLDAIRDNPQSASQKDKPQHVVVDIEAELDNWLMIPYSHDAIRIISGGPGSGKSSFMKMFAVKQASRNERRVLFVPLHRFDPTDDLVNAVALFVEYDGFFHYNPLDPKDGESELLIMFDGLDELSMQGKASSEVAQQFVQEVQKKVDRFNIQQCRLKILISGRELAVQANANELRGPKQILNILPYYVPKEKRMEFEDKSKLLEKDQRQSWWAAYGRASGLSYTSMPQVLNRKELVDVTSQPLLNYLVALSYGRGKVDFEKESNLNVIYEDLVKAVYHRVWGDRPHPATEGISEDIFVRVLEEIAIATWHGDGRSTTVGEIEAHCDTSGLLPLLQKFKENAKEGVTRLLMAFYFRQSGNRPVSHEETFEFTHKSFGEYLTAKRVIRGIHLIHNEMNRRREVFDSGMDERSALVYWINLCSQVPMDDYLIRFIFNEILLQDISVVIKWRDDLSHLISHMLRHGMPIDLLNPRPSFLEETRKARNAEESMLATLTTCASATQTKSKITWPSPVALKEWLSRLQGRAIGNEKPIFLRSLKLLDMNSCILWRADLSQANCSLAELKEANLVMANLSEASLEGALLHNAVIDKANLEDANLSRANLKGASLIGANLRGTNLEEANLEEANLHNAEIDGAIFIGAHLVKAIWIDGRRIKGGSVESLELEDKEGS